MDLRRSDEKRGIKCRAIKCGSVKVETSEITRNVCSTAKILRNTKNARGTSLFAAESRLRENCVYLINPVSRLARYAISRAFITPTTLLLLKHRPLTVLLFNKSTRAAHRPSALFPLLILQSQLLHYAANARYFSEAAFVSRILR